MRLTAQQSLERLPELRTENRIDHWVQSRVEIAEPQEQSSQIVVNDARRARDRHHYHDEERQPAHDERTGYDRQRFGRFAFAFRLQCLFACAHLYVWIYGSRGGSRSSGRRRLNLM